ncbi:MAG: hypothetical protein ABFS30_13985, partial [Pseudomonadota bacterium]
PVVWLYRRCPAPAIRPDDPDFKQKVEQWDKLESFFAGLKNEDGSIRGGVNGYESPDQFQRLLEQHLRDHLTLLLQTKVPSDRPPASVDTGAAPPPLWHGSPYPGLKAYQPEQSAIYFGRGRETDRLLELLVDSAVRFVAVVGASGSGKSSLVAAGLIPRLQAGALPGSRQWRYLRFTPVERGNDPFLALAHALNEQQAESGLRASDLAEALFADPKGFEGQLAGLLGGLPHTAEMFLFIDQFEELFSASVDDEGRRRFIAFLKSASVTPRVRIVATMRSDFFSRSLDFEALAELLRGSGTFALAPPGAGALHEMVSGPAQMASLELGPGLVQAVLDDTGTSPGALPLMAFALSELYRHSGASGSLTLEDYSAIGGVNGAIGRRAEAALKGRGQVADAVLDTLFPELVNLDKQGVATRRRARMERIGKDTRAAELIEHLCTARLLVAGTDENKASTVEIAHEALLESWPRLRDWVAAHREALSARDDLEAAAQAWARSGKPRWSGLPSGGLLKRYRRAATIPDSAQAFLKACRFLEWVR